ncbi:MAG: hypothetical protein ACT4OX_06550 [Actinomycetota bacterium]
MVDRGQARAGSARGRDAARSEFRSRRLALIVIAGALAFLAVLPYLAASLSARRERRRVDEPATPLM